MSLCAVGKDRLRTRRMARGIVNGASQASFQPCRSLNESPPCRDTLFCRELQPHTPIPRALLLQLTHSLKMRQRITFLQEPQDSVDPNLLKVTNNAISTSGVKAAREDRITFGFDELPQELYRVLKASHELHVRWVGQIQYDTIAPLVSRLSPGLHVFYTPQRSSNNSYVSPPKQSMHAESAEIYYVRC
jgi:hypothetical protein